MELPEGDIEILDAGDPAGDEYPDDGLVTLSEKRLFSIVTQRSQVIGIAQSGALSEGWISQ
jgi:hypothetical protein